MTDEEPSRDGDDPDPWGELAESSGDETDPFEELAESEAFTRVERDDVDEDAIWQRLVADEPTETPTAGGDSGRSGEHVVPKASYCEDCEYLASPPEVRCTHDGTEIVGLVDMEHFRVVDCPVVESRTEREDAG